MAAHDPDCTTGTCTTGCGLYIRADLTQWLASGGTYTATRNGTSASPYTAEADWEAPLVEGSYTLTVRISDSATTFCGGGRQTTEGSLEVQVTTVTGEPPVIESLTADPSTVFPDEPSQLACAATDPDGGPVTYAWATDLGTVTPGVEGEATFQSSEVGVAAVTCTATDSAGLWSAETVHVAVVGAVAERSIRGPVVAPQRLAVDSLGSVFVADRGVGGVAVVDLFTGALLYRIPRPEVQSVAVDWDDHLLVADHEGAWVIDRSGGTLLELESGHGEISDVAVDPANQRYGVLHRTSGVVAVYSADGSQVAAFGSTGDAVDQFRGPLGLAATAAGGWVVADTGHGQIKLFDALGALVSFFGDLGGGVGEFVRLEDVAVDAAGVIYASDSFQSWVQVFDPDGSPRELIGTYGEDPGQFKTPTGIAPADAFDTLLVASLNAPSLEVFRTSGNPVTPPPQNSTATPGSLSFGDTAVGSASAAQVVTLTNTGGVPLGIQQVTVQGDFLQTNACGGYVEPGLSCPIEVRFRPSTVGPRVGALLLTTTGVPQQHVVALSGVGVEPAPEIQLAPGSLFFGDQPAGGSSPPQTVTLANLGQAPLQISEIALSAGYLGNTDCLAAVAPGASCTIEVRFAPAEPVGPVPGTLTVTSNSAGSPHSVGLLGYAVSVRPALSIDDLTVEEPDVGTVDLVFTVALSEPTTETVYVSFATEEESATAGEDFVATAGVLTFPPGEVSRPVVVRVVGDELLEPEEETFLVTLTNAIHAEIGTAAGHATIFDNEPCVGPNQVANPSAEQRPDGPGLPGWTEVAGSWWQRRAAPPRPVDGLYSFFSGTAENAELAQDIDVRPFASTIADGGQWFAFDVFVRTLYETAETARVVVEYRDGSNQIVLDAFDTGAFASPAAWHRVSDDRVAPLGTAWIRIRLISAAPGDAYFDAVSLRTLRVASVEVDDADAYEGNLGTTQAVFAVRLACPSAREVTVEYLTADGTALAGEDYLAGAGAVSLPVGQTDAQIAVDIVGDTIDEGHESFVVDLTGVSPAETVVLDPQGAGTIRNDDFCPQGPGFWLANEDAWLVDWLVVGGVEYPEPDLLELLGYSGPDDSHALAAELTATKLSLLRGSDPAAMNIWATVEQADAFLVRYPPGSKPAGEAKQEARNLTSLLDAYNSQECH